MTSWFSLILTGSSLECSNYAFSFQVSVLVLSHNYLNELFTVNLNEIKPTKFTKDDKCILTDVKRRLNEGNKIWLIEYHCLARKKEGNIYIYIYIYIYILYVK